MEDRQIVELFWARDERAITLMQKKYDRYCMSIARNILGNMQDAQECVSDAYLAAWTSIPPHRPQVLSVYLGKIVRRRAISRWRDLNRKKRRGDQTDLALDELADMLPDSGFETAMQNAEITAIIDRFLRLLPETERRVFICRYWRLSSVAEIALRYGFSQSKVKSMLMRTRGKLRSELEREGVFR